MPHHFIEVMVATLRLEWQGACGTAHARNVHSMQLEHVLLDFQTDRGRLFTDASFGGSSTPSGN
jgi:hypothetical protein